MKDDHMLTKIYALLSVATVIILSHIAPAHAGAEVSAPRARLLISNAVIFDGTGNPPFPGDVRVENGVIVAIGDLNRRAGEDSWDAKGLALAPGFIDPHSHHNARFSEQPAPASVLAQGITTVVSGVDGSTELPLKSMFAEFERSPAAVNLASFGPHNNYRDIVMGEDFRRPATAAEMGRMAALLQADMEEGALGLATGVEYDPALYADTAELIMLAKVAAAAGGRYTSHIRSEDINFYPALEELISIAREANIPANISHIKLAMSALWGQAPDVVALLDAARTEGLDITADIYPYDGWQATMKVLLPERDFEDRAAFEYALTSIALPSTIIVTLYEPNPSYVGKTLAEIAGQEGLDPIDMLMKMLQVTTKRKLKEKIIGRNIGEADIRTFMAWPHSSISSDGKTDDLHPRGQGAFPRVLAKYVREKGIFSLSEAIRKMTGLTAKSLGLTDRGLIETGRAADLVLFDPDRITDHGTFSDPVQYATGVMAVWVNGELVWNDGKATGSRPGKILRRPR